MSSAPVIDACIHHHWAADGAIVDHMTPGWQAYMSQPLDLPGGSYMPFIPGVLPAPLDGPTLAEARPEQGPPGSSLELICRDVLDAADVRRAVLSHGLGALTTVVTNPYLADELARAINDWTVEHWLTDGDERLFALAVVPNQLPERAAAEVRRVAAHPRIVGLLLGANGLGRPFGHPVYHPIYEAAAEAGLPIVVRAGCDQPAETLSSPTGGGLPHVFAESYALAAQSLMSAVVSLIAQGVFERHPTLKVLLAGAGSAWIPSLMWRYDNEYAPSRPEVPWLRRQPTDYFREHVRVTTHPLEKAVPADRWRALVSAFDGMREILCYASGYPSWDADTVGDALAQLPPDWHAGVLHDNAERLFRWEPRSTAVRPVAGVALGEMNADL
ncbi:MAG: amidohydrolase [Solirubrobacterales bacterium]|nr:amidohydrolase [Solirubrobacterales bacterium]